MTEPAASYESHRQGYGCWSHVRSPEDWLPSLERLLGIPLEADELAYIESLGAAGHPRGSRGPTAVELPCGLSRGESCHFQKGVGFLEDGC